MDYQLLNSYSWDTKEQILKQLSNIDKKLYRNVATVLIKMLKIHISTDNF